MKKIPSTTQTTPKPNLTNMKETNPTINKPGKAMENKTESIKKNLVEHYMGYDIVEEIKKTKTNISLFELCILPQQRRKLMEAFDPQPNRIPKTIKSDTDINEESIGGKYKSHTLPFLVSFKIFNHNVHKCLVYYGASSNFIFLSICKKINGQPTPSPCWVIQLDKSVVNVIGEMKYVLI